MNMLPASTRAWKAKRGGNILSGAGAGSTKTERRAVNDPGFNSGSVYIVWLMRLTGYTVNLAFAK